MKRTILLISAFFVLTISLATINIASFDLDRHKTHSHPKSAQQQKKLPKTDGSIDPNQISTFSAYELLLGLLSERKEYDPDGRASRAYLRFYGFNDAESAALFNAAFEYKRKVSPLEGEADRIKNAHWPSPKPEVMLELSRLQQQRENILTDAIGTLETQFSNYDGAKLRKQIEIIKRKTKGFTVDLPIRKIGFIPSDLFSAFAQAPGCDNGVDIYSDVVVDWASPDVPVWGMGSGFAPFNNCGHQINLLTSLNGVTNPPLIHLNPAYRGPSESPFVGVWLNGFFRSTSNADVYCPIANQFYNGGSNSSEETVAPYLVVNPFGNFSQATITTSTPGGSSISFSVTASQTANGSFNAEFSYQVVQGSAPMDIFMSGSGNRSISGGQTINVSSLYSASSITSNPTRIKARAIVTSSMRVEKGDQTSTSILTITP